MNKCKKGFFALSLLICLTFVSLGSNALGLQKGRRKAKPSAPAKTSEPVKPPEPVKPKELTRASAAALIKSYPEFKSTYNSRKIPVGPFWYDWRSIKGDYYSSDLDIMPLIEQGLLTLSETGETRTSWWKVYLVELTPAGEAAAKTWVKTSETTKGEFEIMPESPDVTVYRMPLAQRELIEVTGIAFAPGGNNARVEFTWKWVPTAQAKLLPKRVPTEEPQEQAYYFQLYDDGWRIVR